MKNVDTINLHCKFRIMKCLLYTTNPLIEFANARDGERAIGLCGHGE